MAWTAFGYLAGASLAAPADAGMIGLDRGLAAGLACLAAAIGLLLRRARKWVSVGLMLAIAYQVSAQRLAGTLAPDALALAPVFGAALFLWWPQLAGRGADD